MTSLDHSSLDHNGLDLTDQDRPSADHTDHLCAYESDYLAWHARMHDTVGEPFDPRVFLQLARAQWNDRPQLAETFARCTAHWYESEEHLYAHFCAPMHRELQGEHAGCLFLQHPTLGRLVVDVRHDADVPGGLAVSGIEYLERVMRSVMEEPHELYWPAGDAVPTSTAPQGRMRIVHVAKMVVGQRGKGG
jgi:hypothetical protein